MPALFHAAAALALCLLLTACGSAPAPSAPVYQPPAAPPAIAPVRPGQVVLTADWTAPLSASGTCGGSPFACHLPTGTQWGTQQQIDVALFTANGDSLSYTTRPNDGMSLVNAMTVDRTKPMSVRETVRPDTLNCDQGVAYVGPVLYGGGVDDGDPTGRYRAEYISCFAGDKKVRLWLYSPTYAGPIWDYDFRDGQAHELEIDWYPGDHADYWLDGAIVFTESKSFGHDPLDIPTDPHPALWMGSGSGAVLHFDATSGP